MRRGWRDLPELHSGLRRYYDGWFSKKEISRFFMPLQPAMYCVIL